VKKRSNRVSRTPVTGRSRGTAANLRCVPKPAVLKNIDQSSPVFNSNTNDTRRGPQSRCREIGYQYFPDTTDSSVRVSRPVMGTNRTFTPITQFVPLVQLIIRVSFRGVGRRMTVAKNLALMAAGYGLAVAGGIAAIAVNEARMPYDIQQGSPGMVAFGDMVLFVLVTGILSLAPTWFLLKLCVEKIPRTLLTAELLIAVMGPVSWLGIKWMAAGLTPRSPPEIFGVMFGLFIALVGLPRMAFGPVLLVIEGATFFLTRERFTRTLLVGAMLMDLIPLSLFALHMVATTYR
jgi:hypothetical protein